MKKLNGWALVLGLLYAGMAYGQSSLRYWKYRTELMVDNSANPEPLTNYQISFGFVTAGLVREGKMDVNGKDIRLTDSDGKTLLCHWIENSLLDSLAKIWVKIPYLDAGERKTLYLYYGNPDAAPVADGNCTFQVFDDFSASTVEPDKWEQSGNGSLQLTKGKAVFKASGSDIVLRSVKQLQMPVIIEMFVNRSAGKFVSLALTYPSPIFWDGYALALDHERNRIELAHTDPDVTPCSGFSLLSSFKANPAGTQTNGVWSLSWITSNVLFGNWPGGALLEQNSFREQKQRRMALGVVACRFQGEISGELEVDWVRVRKFSRQEPPVAMGPETPNTNAEAIIVPSGYNG